MVPQIRHMNKIINTYILLVIYKCITDTTHDQYNNHSHKIGLYITLSQIQRMNNEIITHITLG